MASVYRRRKKGPYYITLFVRPGVRKTRKGCMDKAATEALARKLEADAMLRREGVIDPKADQYAKAEARLLVVKDANGKVIDGHLADFHASLHAKSTTEKHADLVQSRLVTILDLCNAKQPSQLVPSAVQAAIASLRDGEDNLSLQTCNHYLRAIKQFSRWLWRDGRLREDPLAHLVGFNVQLDRRHDRRALTDEELARLIEAAEKGPLRLSMSGPERAVLYQLAVGTGFRANELRSLTSESFDLDADPPVVTIEAAYSKHRRKDVQPIRPDLADLLRPWLKGKPAEEPVFRLPDKVFKLMQADLAAARDAWLKDAKTDKERQERERSTFLAYRDGGGARGRLPRPATHLHQPPRRQRREHQGGPGTGAALDADAHARPVRPRPTPRQDPSAGCPALPRQARRGTPSRPGHGHRQRGRGRQCRAAGAQRPCSAQNARDAKTGHHRPRWRSGRRGGGRRADLCKSDHLRRLVST